MGSDPRPRWPGSSGRGGGVLPPEPAYRAGQRGAVRDPADLCPPPRGWGLEGRPRPHLGRAGTGGARAAGLPVSYPCTMATRKLVLDVAGREVTVSNPDKVYFPRTGHTKLDLVRYYL